MYHDSVGVHDWCRHLGSLSSLRALHLSSLGPAIGGWEVSHTALLAG
jgi:hypothetical protein